MGQPIEGLQTTTRNKQFNRAAEHRIGRALKSVFAALILAVVLAACAGDSQPVEVPAAQAPAAAPLPDAEAQALFGEAHAITQEWEPLEFSWVQHYV